MTEISLISASRANPMLRGARVGLNNGKFIDVGSGTTLPLGTSLILENGRISALPLPDSENVSDSLDCDFSVNLHGKTVIPALFNTHAHLQLILPSFLGGLDIPAAFRKKEEQIRMNLSECLMRGITHVRDAALLGFPLQSNRRFSDETGSFPRIVQTVVVDTPDGYFTQKTGFVPRLAEWGLGFPKIDSESCESGTVVFPTDATDSQVRDAVDRAVDERGAQAIKVGDQRENRITCRPTVRLMSVDQLCALADQARRRRVPSILHQTSVESFRRGLTAGFHTIAHLPLDLPLTPGDVRQCRESGAILEPTLSLAYAMAYPFHNTPLEGHPQMERLAGIRNRTSADITDQFWISSLQPFVQSGIKKTVSGNVRIFSRLGLLGPFLHFSHMVDTGMTNLRMLWDAGVPLACGNDSGFPPCTPAMTGLELEMADFFLNSENEPGRFRPADALRMATLHSARALGREDSFGTLECGKTADLVVCDGNPLEDFRVLGKPVAALFMDGRLVLNRCGLVFIPVRPE